MARQRCPRPLGNRRFLKVYATDPMRGRTGNNVLPIDVVNEPLEPGPLGRQLRVVDYDGVRKRYYEPVDLDSPTILLNHGLEPQEANPQFHQQMVYAVGMKVLESFERALGRRITFHGNEPLTMVPHAFVGANAYYDRKLRSILFGYFRASADDVGPNLPGQTVFSCLSHDIIAHELTHAVLDRFKPFLLEPSNQDVLAFHEGFADLVALFQHFSYPIILQQSIEQTRANLRERTLLVDLASQFGYASGMNQALRSALGDPDKKLYASMFECHDRGAILVAAVFDAFFTVYQRRINDLIRIATGGTGELPRGSLHPDLVSRVAAEASKAATSLFNMCVRAIDYLPPVDVTFGDYLRALVTADVEAIPLDKYQQRAALIEAFRARGIYPEDVISLAEESIILRPALAAIPPVPIVEAKLVELVASDAESVAPDGEGTTHDSASARDSETINVNGAQAIALHTWATTPRVAAALQLDLSRRVRVQGFHFIFRPSQAGRPRFDLVAQFVQTDGTVQDELGGIPFRGGTTVIAGIDGTVRYIIAKPIGGKSLDHKISMLRMERQREFTNLCAKRDPLFNWHDRPDAYLKSHMALRMNLALVHGG